MLYAGYEMRRHAIDLMGQAIDLQVGLVRKLPDPLRRTLPARASIAAADVYRALRITHDRPDFGVAAITADGTEVEVREEVWTRTPFASLMRFSKADGSSEGQPKVLLVPALSGHFATLVRATISTILADHDVYVIDWHSARDMPVDAGRFGLDEYIDHVVEFLRQIGPRTHLVSICQPAVACLVATSVMTEDKDPATPASLTIMAGPVDTRINPGKVNRYSTPQLFSVLERTVIQEVPAIYKGAGRRVYPGFLQLSGFMGMDPLRHLSAFAELYRDLVRGDTESADRTRAFYEEYFAVLDATEEFYLETVQRIFVDNDLPRGVFAWHGRVVDPDLITCPLFTIEGELDEMCMPGQAEAAHDVCRGIPESDRRHLLQPGVGHYGVFSGSKFTNEIYPELREFIKMADGKAAHSASPTKSPKSAARPATSGRAAARTSRGRKQRVASEQKAS